MQTNTMTSKKSSGCGCSGGGSSGKGSCGCGSKSGSCASQGCGCGGKGCSVCEAPPEAYSRPQFFSGQLLTEDDLQSLADYTVAKNRLHNRMLFGEGVACGLRVSPDVCEPERHLVVRPGYAIDCCGNDIVVPCEARLDVVELVRDLRTRMLGKDCGDPCRDRDAYDCPDPQVPETAPVAQPVGGVPAPAAAPAEAVVVVDPFRPRDPASQRPDQKRNSYCLYVVYCEQPADPVAPYDGADSCGGGECRHTRVREGYRFELRCGKPSGCEPTKRIESKRGFYANNTIKAQRVVQLLGKAEKDVSFENRRATLDLLEENMAEAGPYGYGNANLLMEARGLAQKGGGQARFNSIVALLLISWLRKGDCESFIPDCPPCDEDGVLIACFDFEDCKVSNLCVHRRRPILSPAYFSQLGLTDVWRCLLAKACCGPDQYTNVGPNLRSGVLDSDRMRLFAREGTAMEARAAAVAAPVAASAEISIKELENFMTERLARIDDSNAPESRFTLLPELVRAFDAQVTRAPIEAQVRDETVHKEIAALRGELEELKHKLSSVVKGKAAGKGDKT